MFKPGQLMIDTDGNQIQAHGGGICYHDETYYWFGENKDGETKQGGTHRVDVVGIGCYTSKDLHVWKNEGVILPAVHGDPDHDLHPNNVVERPKVIYNENTRQFVMWMHIDRPDYEFARTGVAVSNSPLGACPRISNEQA